MKRVVGTAAVLLLLLAGPTVHETVIGQAVLRYSVAVTNLTRGQSFTPILVATHTPAVRMFLEGITATPELRELAEEGATSPLASLLRSFPLEVRDLMSTSALLTPGVTVGVQVIAGGQFDRISLASMLIPTNDGFFGVNGAVLPSGNDVLTIYAPAFDAGTERNDERCASIPGPNFAECGGPGGGARVGGGEGAIIIHAGIHGVGDMRASERDWRNPVAKIVIRRAP